MGLLNHLFHPSGKGLPEELKRDAERLLDLWEKHYKDHDKRYELMKSINIANIDAVLQDPVKFNKILKKFRSLIS